MAAANIQGYNFRFKVNSKNFVGVTQDDMSISAITKESITKDDGGVKRKAVTGHDITFKVAGIMMLDSSTSSTALDNDDIIALALSTGSSAVIPFTYVRSSGQAYTGNCIITGYSESTPADGESDSTYSLDIAVDGAMSAQSGGSSVG